MRILVIGGIQFIGREIVRRLAARGHAVSVLHRRAHHDLGAEIVNVQANRADLDAVRRAIRDGRFEAVFDVAYDWQTGTTAEHVEAAARACGDGLHRYVFMSSIAAYQRGLGRREQDSLAPDDDRTCTRRTKPQPSARSFGCANATGFP
jgi:nucleoside-diphosphate-sugar epimerase